jgi:hypothetical protein
MHTTTKESFKRRYVRQALIDYPEIKQLYNEELFNDLVFVTVVQGIGVRQEGLDGLDRLIALVDEERKR